MKTIAHVNYKSVYVTILILFFVTLGVIYSHLYLDTMRRGIFFQIFGEATPYVAYILSLGGILYFLSMLRSGQPYLMSDGTYLTEYRGSKMALGDIVDVRVTRGGFGIKNVTIFGKYKTINIRSHIILEDSSDIVNVIKQEAKL